MSVILVTADMSENQLAATFEQFFQTSKVYSYKKRTLIFHPNDSEPTVFYIKSGYVRVYRISEDGEELTLTLLKPKDFFPLSYGMNQVVTPYYLETITQLELWKAPQDQFLEYIKKRPDILYELTTHILLRFDNVVSRMENLLFCNAYSKVASTLVMCAKRFGQEYNGTTLLKVPLTHRDIATLVGITRETTSLEMKKLENQGILKKSGRFLIIKDIKRLESLA